MTHPSRSVGMRNDLNTAPWLFFTTHCTYPVAGSIQKQKQTLLSIKRQRQLETVVVRTWQVGWPEVLPSTLPPHDAETSEHTLNRGLVSCLMVSMVGLITGLSLSGSVPKYTKLLATHTCTLYTDKRSKSTRKYASLLHLAAGHRETFQEPSQNVTTPCWVSLSGKICAGTMILATRES